MLSRRTHTRAAVASKQASAARQQHTYDDCDKLRRDLFLELGRLHTAHAVHQEGQVPSEVANQRIAVAGAHLRTSRTNAQLVAVSTGPSATSSSCSNSPAPLVGR